MIVDGRTVTDETQIACDVLIVGAGPAGITLAMELEQLGLNVILVESGGTDFEDRAQELNDGTLSALDTTDLMAGRLRLVGGTSNHWGGHCLPLDEIDFARRPLSGLSGWPMSYADMTDAYVAASSYCDLGAFDYSLGAVAGLGASDLLMPDEPGIETKVIRQSTPTQFGEKYGPALKASATTALWLWTTVTGIDIDETGQASRVWARNIDGGDITFRPQQVVLACGAVENARLLMANNARLGTSFGNAGGFLGACYMDHPVGGAAFLHLETPVAKKANWSHDLKTQDDVNVHLVWRLGDAVLEKERLNNTQFFVIPLSADSERLKLQREANQGLKGLKSVAKWVLGRDQRDFELSASYCDMIMNADALAVHSFQEWAGGEGVDRLLLRYESEQLPDRSSYVSLSGDVDFLGQPKPNLHWSPTLADRDSIVKSAIVIGGYAGAWGVGRIELEDHFDLPYWDAHTAWHQLGTTRMALSAMEGVVDGDCLLHGTKNVYVTGGSVFPSGGRANPTMTIVALSVRLAAHLLAQRKA